MIAKIEGMSDTRIAYVSLSLIVAQGGVRLYAPSVMTNNNQWGPGWSFYVSGSNQRESYPMKGITK